MRNRNTNRKYATNKQANVDRVTQRRQTLCAPEPKKTGEDRSKRWTGVSRPHTAKNEASATVAIENGKHSKPSSRRPRALKLHLTEQV